MTKYKEATEFIENTDRPDGPPLKSANLIYMYFKTHPDEGEVLWFQLRDGPDGFAHYLDEQVEKAEKMVFQISGDGDFARNADRMKMYKRKIAGDIESAPKKVDESQTEEYTSQKKSIEMRFILNFDAGWKDLLANVSGLKEAGAELRHYVPATPYDGSHFGVIDEKILFCLTRQPTRDADIKKVVGEPQPEVELSNEPKKTMDYAMAVTSYPPFVEAALNKLRYWWGRAELYESALERFKMYHQDRNIVNAHANGIKSA